LFQNIYSANNLEDSVNLISSIITNNSVEAEAYGTYLENAVPSEIYTQVR
jgi:hypothetical protein